MKIKITLVFFLLFHTCCNAQYAWQALPNALKSWRSEDFFFLTPQLGWATNPCYNYLTPNQYGRIFKTTDGGNTWQKLKDSAISFYRSVGFADSLTGWVGNLDVEVPSDTFILNETRDGGLTWHQANIPHPHPPGVCGISVVTDSIVFAYGTFYGPAGYMKTTNKGASWTFRDMSAQATAMIDGHFFNKDTGFITGGYNGKALILYTTNGGATWTDCYHSARSDTDIIWKLSFPSRNIGYATAQFLGTYTESYNTTFLKTTDGGITWTEHTFIPGYNEEGIGFINDSVGWIGGDNILPNYKTTDGGQTWNADEDFGVLTPPYHDYAHGSYFPGFAINRFRRFGDSLMYAGGNTIYKLNTHAPIAATEHVRSEKPDIKNYPNPFNELTTIAYNLPEASDHVTLEIFGVMAGIAFSRDLGAQGKGDHEYVFNRHLPAGLYYYTIVSGNYRSTRKMTVIH